MRKVAWIAALALTLLVGVRAAIVAHEVRVRAMPDTPAAARDQSGDPLPPFAVARIGSVRFRGAAFGLGWTDVGAALVSCGDDGVVRVFDAETGLVRREFVAHRGVVARGGTAETVVESVRRILSGDAFTTVHDLPLAAAVSRDGRRIVTGGPAAVTVWDLATGARVSTWHAPTSSVNVLAVSDDGAVVAQGGYDGRLDVRDAATGRLVARVARPTRDRGRRLDVKAVALSGDGALVAWTTDEGVRVVETSSGRQVGAASLKQAWGAVALSPRGDALVHGMVERRVGAQWGSPVVFDGPAMSGAARTTEWMLDNAWQQLAFSADGRRVACGGRALRIVDAATGAVERAIDAEAAEMSAVAWSRDGRRVAAVCRGAIRAWDVATGAELHPPDMPRAAPTHVGVTPDGRVVAAFRDRAGVDLFDARTGTFLRSILPETSNEWWNCTSVSDDSVSAWRSTGGTTVNVRTWRLDDGAPIRSRDFERLGIAFPTVSCTTASGRIQVLDPTSGDVAASLADVDDGAVLSLSPDRRHVVETGNAARIRDAGTGAAVAVVALPWKEWGQWVVEAWSADSRAMAFVEGQTAFVVDAATGKKLGGFVAPENDYVHPIALSPDARIAATSGADGAVVLHDVATGDIVATLPGHRGRVSGLVFSADGRTLASCAESVLVWDVARWTAK